jgi:hypothetical protein
MRNKIRFILIVLILGAISLSTLPLTSPVNAQDDPSATADDLTIQLNRRLIENGMRPLARNETLDMIAQTIADELGATGAYTSLPRVLADQMDYARWPDGGQRVINQAFNVITPESPHFFIDMVTGDLINVLQSTFYREVGVGISTRVAVDGGTEQNVYTIVMGAQPNILPVIVNAGSPTVYVRDINLYIHNELSLAYQTDGNVIVRAREIRIANSEGDLDGAEWQTWDPNNDTLAIPWTLTQEYGNKTVWVEFMDDTGFTLRSSTTVTYADPATAPAPEIDPGLPSVDLVMTYGDDTFTLQVVTDRSSVNLEDIYFTWIDGLRAYALSNADALSTVNLEQIGAGTCVQIRLRDLTQVETEGCQNIILEAEEFTDVERVFWNPAFEGFVVFNGTDVLGVCDSSTVQCTVQLQ